MRNLLVPVALVGLVACNGYGSPESTPAPPPAPPGYVCDASQLQEHIGHTATAESGATLLKLSGAKTLRWGPPNSAWTMDYRQDRVNIRYDDAMKITEITCG